MIFFIDGEFIMSNNVFEGVENEGISLYLYDLLF